jgi:hypothetical protein
MDDFGELRSAVHVPSASNWEQICVQLDRRADDAPDELAARILPYLHTHLDEWPDALRTAPRRWVDRLLEEGEVPAGLELVRRLVVRRLPEGLDPIERIVSTPELQSLRILSFDLKLGRLEKPALRLLGRHEGLPHLEELVLRRCYTSEEAPRWLLRAPRTDGLLRLVVEHQKFGARAAELLAAAPLDSLEFLSLAHNELDDRAAQRLARSRHLGALRHLELHTNRIADIGLVALVTSEHLGALRELVLHHNLVGDEGAREIASAPGLERLEELVLHHNFIEEEGARHLLSSPYAGEALRERWERELLD